MPTATLSNPRVAVQAYVEISGGVEPATVKATVNHQPDALAPAIASTAGGIDIAYAKAMSIDTATPTSMDLTSLTDPLGNAIAFAHVVAILITNQSVTDAETIAVGGGTNGLFAADPVPIPAKRGARLWQNPDPGIVVDGTHKILKLAAAAGAAVPVQVTIIGRSA